MHDIDFSLILPCFNEAKNLTFLENQLAKIARQTNGEILLVDNGSTDNTREIIKSMCKREARFRLVEIDENIGYGNGIYRGLQEARGCYLGYTHADAQTNPLDTIGAFELLRTRFNPNDYLFKGRRRNRPAAEAFFTIGMGLFETILFQTRMYDIAAQPTLFSKQFFESMSNPPSDFSFDLFVYLHGKRTGKVFRFDIDTGERKFGSSSWNTGLWSKMKLIWRTVSYSLKLRLGRS